MNTKRFYVIDQDNVYYCCKTETELYENVLRKFSFNQIGLTLNDKHCTYDHFRNTNTGHYVFERREYKVDIVVFDDLWRVVTHDQLKEIIERAVAEREKKYRKRWYGKWGKLETYRYRFDPVPHVSHKWRFGRYYRHPKTTQEARMSYACSPEYVRKSRNHVNIPKAWDDIPRSDMFIKKSWKKNKKEKQWM